MSLYSSTELLTHLICPNLCLTVVVGGIGGIWEIEMKGQTCKGVGGRLWHKRSLGCQHRAEVGWGQGDTGRSGHRGSPAEALAQSARLSRSTQKQVTLCSAREFWNSLPCLLPVPSASIFKLSFPFYRLSPQCHYLQSPTHGWMDAAVNTQCCAKLDRSTRDSRGICWAVISTFHTSESHLGFTFSKILIRGFPLIFLGTLNDPGETAGMLNLL